MKLTPWEPDLRSLVDRIDSGSIDLQPEFQRQEVWSPTKKKRLIDTVLRGWSIPPVHFVVTSEKRLEVLDGQQRLASIRDFFNNRFSIDGQITPIDSHIQSLNKKTYAKLESPVRLEIDQYPLRCFRISDYSPDEPSELFYRLNQPTMLTAGEQRNALYGPARFQLKDAVSHFIELGNDSSSLGFSNTRLAYDDIIARLLYFLEAGTFGQKGTEARISERFRSRHAFPDDVFNRATRAISHFSVAIKSAPHYRLNKASLLSWLLFFSRFDDKPSNPHAIDAFLEARNARSTTRKLISAAIAFEDRASLRVTDVSSVVIRDVALWYIYAKSLTEDAPRDEILKAVEKVDRFLQNDPTATFEEAVLSCVEQNEWSALL